MVFFYYCIAGNNRVPGPNPPNPDLEINDSNNCGVISAGSSLETYYGDWSITLRVRIEYLHRYVV